MPKWYLMRGQIMPALVAVVAVLALAGCGDGGPWSGPFGTKKGVTQGQLSSLVKLAEDRSIDNITVYSSRQAPKPSADISEYSYAFGRSAGLCSVSGLVAGGDLNKIVSEATERYGSPASPEKGSLIWSSATHVLSDELVEIEVIGHTPAYSMISYVFAQGEDCR